MHSLLLFLVSVIADALHYLSYISPVTVFGQTLLVFYTLPKLYSVKGQCPHHTLPVIISLNAVGAQGVRVRGGDFTSLTP